MLRRNLLVKCLFCEGTSIRSEGRFVLSRPAIGASFALHVRHKSLTTVRAYCRTVVRTTSSPSTW
jgi:hypothetical protein